MDTSQATVSFKNKQEIALYQLRSLVPQRITGFYT